MAKIIKDRGWKKKRNPQRGAHLQHIANRMLRKKETGRKYRKIRSAAEFHLGFWDWQRKSLNFGKTRKGFWRSQTDASLPKACTKVKCPYLPAGSAACIYKNNECP